MADDRRQRGRGRAGGRAGARTKAGGKSAPRRGGAGPQDAVHVADDATLQALLRQIDRGEADEARAERAARAAAEDEGPAEPVPWPEDDGVEYQPAPPPRVEVPRRFLADYYDDPGYKLRPWAVAGPSGPGGVGVIGRMRRAGEKIAVRVSVPLAHGYFGVPESGKTYMLGNLVELSILRTRYLNVLPVPGCAIAVYLRSAPQLLASVSPNRDERQIERLVYSYGSLPQGVGDVVWLTSPAEVAALRARHPQVQVHGLRSSCAELGLDNLRAALGIEPDDPSPYARQVDRLLQGLPEGFTYETLWEAAKEFGFRDEGVRRRVLQRLRTARRWIDDRRRLRSLLRPGRLIVVDLRGAWLGEEEAARLCGVLLDVLVLSQGAGREGPVGRLPLTLIFDEAQHFVRWPRLRDQLERLVRERRHYGVALGLGSQNPLALPTSLLGQLDGIGVFRHGSRRWNRHLAEECRAFEALTAEQTAAQDTGQMCFWSQNWEGGGGELGADNLVQLDIRPRLSHHGEV